MTKCSVRQHESAAGIQCEGTDNDVDTGRVHVEKFDSCENQSSLCIVDEPTGVLMGAKKQVKFWSHSYKNQSILICAVLNYIHKTPLGALHNQRKREPTGTTRANKVARKNWPVGRNLEQILTEEGRHLPLTSQGMER